MVEAGIQRTYRVAVHGLPFFCRKLLALLNCDRWDVRYHYPKTLADKLWLANDLRSCDLAYTWGGRITMGKFLWAARCFGKRKIVVLWSGSDVLYAQRQYAKGKVDSWVADKIHWAVSPWLAEEVRTLGIACEYVQASFVEAIVPVPLPENFSVLVYVPNCDHGDLYGWGQIAEVAQSLPNVEFTLVGCQQGQQLHAPSNVKVYGRISDVGPFFRQATVVWRPVRHDGLSFMVLEALAHGRHVVYSCPFAACRQATTAQEARHEIQRLLELHNSGRLLMNEGGIRLIAREFAADTVRDNLLKRWEDIILSRPSFTLPASASADQNA